MSRRLTTRNTADRTDAGMMRTPIETVQDSDAFNNGYQYTTHSLHGSASQDESKVEKQKNIENAAYPYGMVAYVKKPTGQKPKRQAAEGLLIYPTNTRSHGIVIALGDRRYRLYKLKEGEVAFHDDQGQQVHFTRDGIISSVPNSKKIVHQIMEDDKLPQDENNKINGEVLGQIPQYGRNTVAKFTLDKDHYTIDHPNADFTFNCKTFKVNASGDIKLISGANMLVKGVAAILYATGSAFIKAASSINAKSASNLADPPWVSGASDPPISS